MEPKTKAASLNLTDIVASGDLSSLKARLLSESVSGVNMPMDGGGATLLHLAANSTIDVLSFLLDNNADPHCQTEDGLTPLHVAAMWGRTDLVSKLLSFGADPFSTDNEGLMPIDYAKNESHQACVDLLNCESCGNIGYGQCDLDHTCAESFVAMFETFSAHGDASTSFLNYPDVVEDTLQASPHTQYQTAICSTGSGSPTRPQKSNSIATTPGSLSLDQNVKEIRTSISAEIQKLSDCQIRERLISLGEKPGPINKSTRLAYMVYLTKLESGGRIEVASSTSCKEKCYKYELTLVLNGISPLPNVRHLEAEVVKEFAIPSVSNCTGSSRAPARDNFNYLLLDPQHIDDSTMDQTTDDLCQFRQFIEAVFYVGKGKNSRPIQHLKDAKIAFSNGHKLNSKLEKIASIWKQGLGVISLPMYHNTHCGEAFTRECCMIDTIGLENLTNQVRGHLHGTIQQWSLSKRRQYGVYLLYKAFKVFKLTGPPQIYQQDL